MLRAPLVVIAAALALAATPAAPAAAAPTWLAPSALSAAGVDATAPQVAVDAHGDAVAAWQRAGLIEVASRSAGAGPWQPPQAVSDVKAVSSQPQVAIDAAGDAVVVWLSTNGGEESVQASARTGVAGSWSSPATLGKVGATPVGPQLAVDARGDAVVAWRHEAVIEASRRTGVGPFGAPEMLSEHAEEMEGPRVGIDSAGEATAVWEGVAGGVVIEAASASVGGKWTTPQALSVTGGVNVPRLAVDARGDAIAIWEHFFEEAGSGKEIEHIEASTRPAGSAKWGGPALLTHSAEDPAEAGNQEVAVDGHGDGVVIWERMVNAKETVEASEDSGAGSAWSTPVAVSPLGVAEGDDVVGVDEQGKALVAFDRLEGIEKIVEAASGLASTGVWQPAAPVSAAGGTAQEPQVALDAQGNAAAVWSRLGSTSYIAEATGFDAAGPQLSSLAVPTSGTVGQPLTFSVSALDVWSAFGAPSWSFGDGAAQSGTSVTHTYAAPGSYSLTVTGTDALGNSSRDATTVAIAAASSAGHSEGIHRGASSSPPRITAARMTHSRFRVAKRATAISAAAVPRGTRIVLGLSEAATLRITFTHTLAGLRSGRRCVAPSGRLRAHHARRCTRTLSVGTLTRASERQGVDGVAFSGRVGTRPLAPGSYRAVLVASAGGRVSAPVALPFQIVRG